MRHSLDALITFAHVADAGSFSAAARQMDKSQSSVSEAIANLEIDLGVHLFDRSGRQPKLTAEGAVLLTQARVVMDANAQLERLANAFSRGLETRLTVALSDAYEWTDFEYLVTGISQRYPRLTFECMVAESHDVLDSVLSGRAHIGLLAALDRYPADLARQPMPDAALLGLYVAPTHPLAALDQVTSHDLAQSRQLRLNTYARRDEPVDGAQLWSAPSYLMLLEMAVMNFGWAILPTWMVQRYAPTRLVALNAPGWPQTVGVDAIWHAQRGLGAAGAWLLSRLVDPLRAHPPEARDTD